MRLHRRFKSGDLGRILIMRDDLDLRAFVIGNVVILWDARKLRPKLGQTTTQGNTDMPISPEPSNTQSINRILTEIGASPKHVDMESVTLNSDGRVKIEFQISPERAKEIIGRSA